MTGLTIPGGPSFIGFPQPPDVPCDPTGEGWRGPPGPVGPKGDKGDKGSPGVASDGVTALATATGVGANTSIVTIPARAVIMTMTVQETAGSPVNVSVGKTAGASDVMPAVAVAANQLLTITQLSFTTLAFATPQALFINSTSWGSARVTVKVWYGV